MKHYYTNYEDLVQAWVEGEVDGEIYTAKRRMFAALDAIYSYGHHFCIARRWQSVGRKNEWFLLTERRFSPTTETHKYEVYRQLPKDRTILLPQVDNLHAYGLINGTDEDLATVLLETECDRLDKGLDKYLKMLRPYSPEYLEGRVDEAQKSLARLGQSLPDRLLRRIEDAKNHCHTRTARNAVLDATLNARRRLLAA
jgi:gamma-glutamylcyclotransferase (GGCT)/AIG2-like uncharacterized protein YtfP